MTYIILSNSIHHRSLLLRQTTFDTFPTFFFLAIAAYVGVVTVEWSCCSMGATAVILCIQCVDGDVDQMEDHFTAIHISVRVLRCIKTM